MPLAALLLLAAASPALASCPAGWLDPSVTTANCYRVSESRMDWGTAQEFCWLNGGFLAEFFHTGEELYIDAFLNRDVVYWIGLSDFAHEDTWRWQESHELAVEYSRWKAGQPSGAGDCAFKSFFQLWNGAWGDGECTLGEVALHGPAHALCQMQKS